MEYPVSRFITCIKVLKKGYPTVALKSFISYYTANFTRETDPDHIFFDGHTTVRIEKIPGKVMTNDEITTMLKDLVGHHSLTSGIGERFIHAARELSKEKGVTAPPKPPPQPKAIKLPTGEEQLVAQLLEIGVPVTDARPGLLVFRKEDAPQSTGNEWYLWFPTAPNIYIEAATYALKVAYAHPQIYEVHLLTSPDVIKDIAVSRIILKATNDEPIGPLVTELNDKLPDSIVKEITRLSPPLPPFFQTLGSLGSSNGGIIAFHQGTTESRVNLISLGTKYNVRHDRALELKFDGLDHYKERGSLGATVDLARYREVESAIEKQSSLRGQFDSLLFTHNTSLNVALRLLSGEYKNIQGVEPSDPSRPFGRGAQFRWGVDSQYGDVMFIMKPQFWRNYTKGATMASMIVDYPVFLDLFQDISGDEKTMFPTMQRDALNFNWRPHDAKQDPVQACQGDDRKTLTWCNIQLHIGENVSLFDVDTVLVPRYLVTSGLTLIDGRPIDKFLDSLQSQIELPDIGLNPFYGRIEYYGPKTVEKHYTYIAKSTRADYYSTLSIKAIPSSSKEAVQRGMMRDPAYIGTSSKISISAEAYTSAEKEYFKRLLYHELYARQYRDPSAPSAWLSASSPQSKLVDAYISDVTGLLSFAPPSKPKDATRVATYNVHYWTDSRGVASFNGIWSAITTINADVIGLQEAVIPGSGPDDPKVTYKGYTEPTQDFGPLDIAKITHRGASSDSGWSTKDFFTPFANYNYKWVGRCAASTTHATKGSVFGNILFVREGAEPTFRAMSLVPYKQGRCAVIMHLDKFIVCNLHLDVFDTSGKTRREELSQVLDYLDTKPNVPTIIMGDFNALRRGDYTKREIEWLGKNNEGYPLDFSAVNDVESRGFQDAFGNLKFSVWSARRVDYIFTRNIDPSKLKAYPYYTTASDHIPLVVDVLP